MRVSYTAKARARLGPIHPEVRDQRVRCLVTRFGLGGVSLVQVDTYYSQIILLTPRGDIKTTTWLQLLRQ